MINRVNPYTPGSGRKPGYLAGRDAIIDEAERRIVSTMHMFPERSVVYYGLRGVGKTVLLNAVEDIAYDMDVLCEHIEIKEHHSFLKDISIASQKLITSMSFKENIKDKLERARAVLKRISLSWDVNDGSVSAQLSDMPISSDISNDFIDLFVSLGKIAKATGNTICFFIDEIQYIKTEQLEGLLMALHRVNQLALPIIIFCAGLPKVLKTFGDVKTYSERLFTYTPIDSLSKEDARAAIIEPAKMFKATYTSEAIEAILENTGCYPYFIQELCNSIWHLSNSLTISLQDVLAAIPVATEQLDNSFFKVRFDRCTEHERNFAYAMVKCGELPCTVANVAMIMGKSVQHISPVRATLINKGIIYSTGYGEIDFTVPKFDEYLIRQNPEIQSYLNEHYKS